MAGTALTTLMWNAAADDSLSSNMRELRRRTFGLLLHHCSDETCCSCVAYSQRKPRPLLCRVLVHMPAHHCSSHRHRRYRYLPSATPSDWMWALLKACPAEAESATEAVVQLPVRMLVKE